MPESCVPSVGVGVLLVDERNHVLLTLRIRPPEAGRWSIVGGKLEFLETLEECAAREVREEVGVEVSIQSLLCLTDHCPPQENQHWVRPAYLAKIRSRQAANCEPEKTADVPWFPLDRLPPNLTITASNAIRA